jgi:F-type H+-transporting ATPase subunit b
MVSLDATIFLQITNFLLLIFILNVLLYKPILKIMNNRKMRLQSSDDEIKALQQTIEQKTAEYEEKIRLAKLEAMNQRNEIQKEGAEEGKRIIDQAKEEIAKMLDDFKIKMAKEMDDARQILNTRSRAISMEIAEKVLGRSIS